jgi:hypothetical protein
MEIKELKPRKALNKAFLKVKPNRTEMEGFKQQDFIKLVDDILLAKERTEDTTKNEI